MKKKECCPPGYCVCDMRGMLSFLILWLLSKKPMHGQEIAKELEKRRGFKPSPGTIYPALKELKKRGLIKGEKKGKVVVYSLTETARKEITKTCRYFCKIFFDVFEKHKVG
ncbi:MAG: PadR family transcriptional regulator [Candidatus Hadarchaeota archaeon]